MGPNQDNSISITSNDGTEAETQQSVDGPFPNSRGTMYYQLKAFLSEVKAQSSIPQDKRARTDSYSAAGVGMKLASPTDAEANMVLIDSIYKAAGMSARPSLSGFAACTET